MGSCGSNKNSRISEPPKQEYKDKVHQDDQSAIKTTSKPKPLAKKEYQFTPLSKMSKLEDILVHYDFDRHLGLGTFGLVREGINKKTKQKFAIKTIFKDKPKEVLDFLANEIEILLSIDNEKIVKCYEVYEDISTVNIVMELINGGQLFDYIINSATGKLDVKEALSIFSQMIDSVHILHCDNFVHRDIKPENFLINFDKGVGTIKLIDMGFATSIKPNEKLSDRVGSLNYVAPEFCDPTATYDNKVDIWALGICLYNMLTGKQAFSDPDSAILVAKIRNDPINFDIPQLSTIPKDVLRLLQMLLTKDPENRLSTFEIKNTPWISKLLGTDDLETNNAEFNAQSTAKNMQNFLQLKKNLKAFFLEFCMLNLTNKDIEVFYLFRTLKEILKVKVTKMIFLLKK